MLFCLMVQTHIFQVHSYRALDLSKVDLDLTLPSFPLTGLYARKFYYSVSWRIRHQCEPSCPSGQASTVT